jgi:cytochrome c5
MLAGLLVSGQSTGQGGRPVTASPAATSSKPAAPPAYAAAKQVLDDYCVECHNKSAKTANLAIDALNIAQVQDNVTNGKKSSASYAQA